MPIKIPVPDQAAASEHHALIEQNSILRNANQNLLMATFGAEDLRDQAEAAHRRQNEFLAMLAHELRNPLAPIGMASALLGRMPNQTPELLNIKSIIDRQVGQLARLLDDLLDAARISSGKIELQKRPLLVAVQLANALETVQSRLAERHQQLVLDLPDHDIWICGDAVRLAQVFSNLLVNASKFTQDGGQITLSASVLGNQVMIKVSDNGAGIAVDVLPNIFALFSQGPRSLARSEGGLGVGLNIVRNVTEMHGGSVTASSTGLGHGTVFTVMLPLHEAINQADPVEVPGASCISRHILLVEDNADASEMLKMVLCSEGHTVVTAFDGVTGLALAASNVFDVMLCDIGLPGMNGYDLVRNLRVSAGMDAPFCIAVSGYGQSEDRTLAQEAGFDRHLVKPIDLDILLELVAAAPLMLPHD